MSETNFGIDFAPIPDIFFRSLRLCSDFIPIEKETEREREIEGERERERERRRDRQRDSD